MTALPAFVLATVERLSAKCDDDPWSVDAFDFGAAPPPLSREDEAVVVQYLTDFIHIEQMAGAFFRALAGKVEAPELIALLERFVADEDRHAAALERLARFHDTRRLRKYSPSPTLVRLAARLGAWIELAPADVAAIGVTVGEIGFDIAYLGPLEAFLDDPTTTAVLARIHRDEARHLALDYLLLDAAPSLASARRQTVADHAALTLQWARVLAAGFPFMRDNFFGTSAVLDPTGARLEEAARRIQLAMARPAVRQRPMGRVYAVLQTAFDAPGLGPMLRGAFGLVLGANPNVFRGHATAAELSEARSRSATDTAHGTWLGFALRTPDELTKT